jgi:hypothetical protein
MDVRERNHRIRNNRGTRDYRSMTRHTWSSSSSGDATPRWSARDRSEPAGSNRPRWYRRGCGSESSKSYDWSGVPQGGRWQETCFYERDDVAVLQFIDRRVIGNQTESSWCVCTKWNLISLPFANVSVCARFRRKQNVNNRKNKLSRQRILRGFSHISFIWGVLSHEIQCHRQNEGGDEKENFWKRAA